MIVMADWSWIILAIVIISFFFMSGGQKETVVDTIESVIGDISQKVNNNPSGNLSGVGDSFCGENFCVNISSKS